MDGGREHAECHVFVSTNSVKICKIAKENREVLKRVLKQKFFLHLDEIKLYR